MTWGYHVVSHLRTIPIPLAVTFPNHMNIFVLLHISSLTNAHLAATLIETSAALYGRFIGYDSWLYLSYAQCP